MIYLIWLGVFVITIVLYFRQIYSRFSANGVAHFEPIPVLGNAGGLTLRRYHVAHGFDILYRTFPNERFMGRYEMMRPVIVIRDLDLVKKIAIKDFEHFIDHRSMVDETVDPFFGRNLFSLRGQEWKDMRSTLSPAFTSSKMRGMVPFMVEVNTQMIRAIINRIENSQSGYVDTDCKDLTTRYANDVIASCAFGVKVDSHTEENNEFYAMGHSTANFGFRRVLVYLGYNSFPYLMKQFNVKLFSDATRDFFKNLVLSSMKHREERGIIRPDMIHLLMEAKKGKLIHEDNTKDADAGFATVEESDIGKSTVIRDWSDNDLIAQALLFFVAGFETISSTMSMLIHELAVNPDVQERVYQEIREHDAKNNGKFDFNSIQNLVYLDMVISEVLRMWPPAVGLDRLCVKDYNLGKPNSKAKNDYIIRKGESIVIPVYSIHRNPNYFPNPDKFDPERFSEKNKHNIKPFTYMPFGAGPRNCIGSRFALCEVKVMVYELLQKLEISPCEKTCIPAKLATNTFNIRLVGGHWARFKIRNKV